MTPRDNLATLVDVACISEDDKARILAALPLMTDEEVHKLGVLFAQQELALDAALSSALHDLDTALQRAS